jgi:hypothetical protein
MNVWDWVNEFEHEAALRGDTERVRMANLHGEAYRHRHTDPDRMLAILEEGRRMARALNEPWWALFFDHWIVETHIYYKDDYRDVVDRAVRSTLELRKPVFEHHPLRFCVYSNLIAAYLCVDPVGYADPIREGLDYLETLISPEGEEKHLLIARQHWFHFELGQMETSRKYCMRWLAFTEDEPDFHLALHHGVGVHVALCHTSHRLKEWEELAGYATRGEELARTRQARFELSIFLIWQALYLRRQDRREEAARLFRLGTSQMSRLGKKPDDSYYEAACAYHEMSGKLHSALNLRNKQLDEVKDKGQFATEVDCRLERLRLLRTLGEPPEFEIALAREAIGQLRKPESYQERLERILAGDGPAH